MACEHDQLLHIDHCLMTEGWIETVPQGQPTVLVVAVPESAREMLLLSEHSFLNWRPLRLYSASAGRPPGKKRLSDPEVGT